MATLLSMQDYESSINVTKETRSGPERKPRSLKELDVRQAVLKTSSSKSLSFRLPLDP